MKLYKPKFWKKRNFEIVETEKTRLDIAKGLTVLCFKKILSSYFLVIKSNFSTELKCSIYLKESLQNWKDGEDGVLVIKTIFIT